MNKDIQINYPTTDMCNWLLLNADNVENEPTTTPLIFPPNGYTNRDNLKLTIPQHFDQFSFSDDSEKDSSPHPVKRGRKPSGVNKSQERLIKNRESARESRKKKKMEMEVIQRRMRDLEDENRRLLLELKQGKEHVLLEEAEKWDITKQLSSMLQSGATDEEISKTLHMFGDKYSDYGSNRTKSLLYHIEELDRLLLPTQVTKMCMWSLHQDDDFFKEEVDDQVTLSTGGSIWTIMCQYLGVSDNQKRAIKEKRSKIRTIISEQKETLRLLDTLKQRIVQHNNLLDQEMNDIQSVLTPTQAARFIMWVTDNAACMQMLNKLWSTSWNFNSISAPPTPKPEL